MQIEIAKPERMSQSGQSLLRLIQNNDTPILDLLVRESIQNSMDARNLDSDYVDVRFKTGSFISKQLTVELDGVDKTMNKKYSSQKYDYLAIQDRNTVGLTGPLHDDEVEGNNFGNLLKLIYHISKPQENEGAGGSWGLGKTIYFRIGIGLVIYYSRINQNGIYKSRLAACLVEDETKKDSLIPSIKGKTKRGLAWWGKQYYGNENSTVPVEDERYIKQFLKIFNIEPYSGFETGTTIIIPYIDKDYLLENNRIERKDSSGNTIEKYWDKSIEEYLTISVQRWFAPRLNNSKFKYGSFLRVFINENPIKKTDMEPVFQIVQSLYNRSNKNYVPYEEDILSDKENAEVYIDEIKLNNVLKETRAGYSIYAKVNRKLLKMDPPFNKYSPAFYCNCEFLDSDYNRPIMMYTRKPGMIVSYENVGSWVDKINPTDQDHYLIGIFVLNSGNQLKNTGLNMSLEEYVRKGEMADHKSWGDQSIGRFNPRIVSKIQASVTKKIASKFSDIEPKNIKKSTSGLSKLLGELLLPPENFGNGPTIRAKRGGGSSVTEKVSGGSLKLNPSVFTRESLLLTGVVKTKASQKTSLLYLQIDSDSSKISLDEWETASPNLPFYINQIKIKFKKIDNKNVTYELRLDEDYSERALNGIKASIVKTPRNKPYAVKVIMKEECNFEYTIEIDLKVLSKQYKPILALKMSKEEK